MIAKIKHNSQAYYIDLDAVTFVHESDVDGEIRAAVTMVDGVTHQLAGDVAVEFLVTYEQHVAFKNAPGLEHALAVKWSTPKDALTARRARNAPDAVKETVELEDKSGIKP